MSAPTPLTYREAGVDIDAGDALVERIKPFAQRTMRPEVLGGIGGFGALVEVSKKYKNPVMVSGTDGVGTKLKLAFRMKKHDTIGIDLVAMSVNDILVSGAEPIFFLDYFACSKLDVAVAESVVKGIAAGCEQAGCALIGGETAEMPGMYDPNEYDLAGFAVGLVEKSAILDGTKISAGDAIIGLASSGPHSNGFSLIRKVLAVSGADLHEPFDGERTLGHALLEPTRIYVKPVLEVMGRVAIKGLAHITGGGLTENIPRILPEGVCAKLEAARWPRPAIFQWLQRHGGIEEAEMVRTFNCGIGMIVVVAQADAKATLDAFNARGVEAFEIGTIAERAAGGPPGADRLTAQVKTAVILISGRGSNMRAIVEARTGLAVKAVISYRADAAGLAWAQSQGIATRVVDPQDSPTREAYDERLAAAVDDHAPDLLLLAGYMRILTDGFVRRYERRMLNIHPSLLPAFPGLHTHRRALAAGVKLHGATVHVVTPALDGGPIVIQGAVPVLADDTEETLAARVLQVEHRIYPQAVRWFLEDRIEFTPGNVVQVRRTGAADGWIAAPRNLE